MSTLRVSTIQDTAGSNSSTPAAIANGIAKAWVNFNGTGTVAIRAQYNVSSITDNGVGDYYVNLSTAMSDANYGAHVTTQSSPADGPDSPCVFYNRTANVKENPTTSSYRLCITASNGIAKDRDYVCTSVFR